MKMRWMGGLLVAGGLMLLGSAALAGGAEIENKAQETQVTLSMKDATADSVLKLISSLSGITITKKDMPKDPPKVTVDLKAMPVIEAVKLVASKAGLTCAIVDDGIEVSGAKKN